MRETFFGLTETQFLLLFGPLLGLLGLIAACLYESHEERAIRKQRDRAALKSSANAFFDQINRD